ncbi:MAG TPA: nuclear transport factor 2 family protein [Acidimicrobiales bacterium]
MTLSLQEISDRMEIQDLLVDYSHAIDTRSWDALDDIFTADALIDYSAMGGARGGVAEIKAFLAETMPMFSSTQHMVATSKVTVRGDVAEGRTICHNPMVLSGDAHPRQMLWCGLWYRDRFVRTPAGWRIQERVEEKSYMR